jgi:hypothetical protein
MAEARVAKPSDIRGTNSYLFEVRPGIHFRLRVLDMTTVVLNNLIPFDLLKAAKKFEDIQRGVAEAGGSDSDAAKQAMDKLDPKILEQYVEFLKHYACTVIIEPKMSPTPTEDPEKLFVGELSGDELMEIFKARYTPNVPGAPKEEPRIASPEVAEDFRRTEAVPDVAPPLPGQSVRNSAQLVDFPDREAITQ